MEGGNFTEVRIFFPYSALLGRALPVNEASDKSSSIINGMLFLICSKSTLFKLPEIFNLDMDDS